MEHTSEQEIVSEVATHLSSSARQKMVPAKSILFYGFFAWSKHLSKMRLLTIITLLFSIMLLCLGVMLC